VRSGFPSYSRSRANRRGDTFPHAPVHQSARRPRVTLSAIDAADPVARRRGRGAARDIVLARLCAAANGWTVVSDTSWDGYTEIPRDVMQGYGVMIAEAFEQGAAPTHVFVQGGVGGVAAAVVAHVWERFGPARPRVVVVEPDKADCLTRSAEAGKLTQISGDLDTIMAGLSCGEPSPLAWAILATGADAFMSISDETIAPAMRRLADHGVVGGESGVVGVAALEIVARDPDMRAALALDARSRVLLFGTEGATDPALYAELVGRGAESVSAPA
jgi:diaminopropionate ammonia-lyase